MTAPLQITRLPGRYAIARLAPDAPVPDGLMTAKGFVSVSRTADELSLTAPEPLLADLDRVEPGWAAFRVEGPLDFGEIGILSGLAAPLAEAGVGIFVVSTFDTDYILVKADAVPIVQAAWQADGHDISGAD